MMKIWNNKVASRNVSDISPFSSFIRKLGDTEDSRSGLRPNLQRDHRVHLWRDRVRIPVVGGVRGGRNIFPLASRSTSLDRAEVSVHTRVEQSEIFCRKTRSGSCSCLRHQGQFHSGLQPTGL